MTDAAHEQEKRYNYAKKIRELEQTIAELRSDLEKFDFNYEMLKGGWCPLCGSDTTTQEE